MKRLLAALSLSLFLIPIGCNTVTANTPPAALAPGYNNSTDQGFGQALAAARALANQASTDYAKLTTAQQSTEKTVLNSFVTAVNAADSMYLAYHAGTATAAQVQTALNAATAAQTSYTAATTGAQ